MANIKADNKQKNETGTRGHSNKLVGQIGEFLVCAELGRRGYIATPFAGNVPGYDVIAIDRHHRCVPIQVKTSNGGDFQFNASKYLEILFDEKTKIQTLQGNIKLMDPSLLFVFVLLQQVKELKDRFFVCTALSVQEMIFDEYSGYLERKGGRRPKSPESRHSSLRVSALRKYEDNWNLVGRMLKNL